MSRTKEIAIRGKTLVNSIHWLDWPAPQSIQACYTGRNGGVSQSPYQSFNLATHVGDNMASVKKNRKRLTMALNQIQVAWLQQVHGAQVVTASTEQIITADASQTRKKNLACCVMTADCLPVFLCDQQGQQVAIAHAGWRGLCQGILQKTLATFADPTQVLAYLGPAISQAAFEVGDEVRQAFLTIPQAQAMGLQEAFTPGRQAGKWMANLYQLARTLLQQQGLRHIYGGDRCTYSEPKNFFSYRRDGQTGRIASLIWISGAD